MKITAIVEPFQTSSQLPTFVSQRTFNEVDRLLAELALTGNVLTEVAEDITLSSTTETDYFLLFDASQLTLLPHCSERSILINADRSSVLATLEKRQLLGAIEKQNYFQWRAGQQTSAGHIFARRDVLKHMGINIASGPFSTNNYAPLRTASGESLPGTLARYLKACKSFY